VPPGAFFPRPNVDSSVVQMVIGAGEGGRLQREQWTDFFAFVSKAFGMRRKKLAKSVGKNADERERAERLLVDIGCGQFSRPEDLTAGEWVELYKRWSA
jgi:16S rRNA A1518/A1519 N6-dimethyltransferase RsmA/KsgA/DIM1 with predicted DNA glycosylase/AP lyase activity